MSFQGEFPRQVEAQAKNGAPAFDPSTPSFNLEFLDHNLWSAAAGAGAAGFVPGSSDEDEGDAKGFLTPPSSPSSNTNIQSSSSRCPSRSKFPAGLAQKIGYLQMVIQMLGSNSQARSGHEQIVALVDQLLVTARGMFLEQQQLQQQQQHQSGGLALAASSDPATDRIFAPQPAQQFASTQVLFQQQQFFQQGARALPKSEESAPPPALPPPLPPDCLNAPLLAALGGDHSGEQQDEEESLALESALARDSFELIELDAMEILAEHTHFCDICGKGFKRDANLRMHMRGHGDEYKTPAALARPKDLQLAKGGGDLGGSPALLSRFLPKRYSCPYVGCKRNRQHKKFVPLKTVLCVKNHYRRSHCPKLLSCTRCRLKRFAVLADLKTHEKHCGREKWQCSCGTTFSRKDKLLGHISLFVGHRPLVMLAPTQSPTLPPIILPSSSSGSSFSAELSPVSIYNIDSACYPMPASANSNTAASSKFAGDLSMEAVAEGGSNANSNPHSHSPRGDGCWSPSGLFGGGRFGSSSGSGDSNNGDHNNNGLAFLGFDFLDCKN